MGMTLKELREKGIPCYPDNDGGLWYWGKKGTEKVEEKPRYFSLYLNGNKICPKCTAMMVTFSVGEHMIFKCNDCKAKFIPVTQELSDKEIVVKEVAVS